MRAMVPDASVDEIEACHLFEHLALHEAHAALREWARVLKPGGRLFLELPNFDACVRILGTAVDGRRDTLGMAALLLGGALAVGLLAELAELLGADPLDVLFSGQASIPAVVGEDSTKIIVVLLVAKFLAYGVSLGCGIRGGRVIGKTSLDGMEIAERPVSAPDLFASLVTRLGIDPAKENLAANGRPIAITDKGTPLADL